MELAGSSVFGTTICPDSSEGEPTGLALPSRGAQSASNVSAPVAGPSQVDQPVAGAAFAALVALAEELGRLPARRELAEIRSRRGYGLSQLLLGMSIMAVALILIAGALS